MDTKKPPTKKTSAIVDIIKIASLQAKRDKKDAKSIIRKDKALYRADREINLNHFRELMQIFQVCFIIHFVYFHPSISCYNL
jgi:hypothetical protein